jgi:hypothetical protein
MVTVEIFRHSKSDAVRFDREWRSALRTHRLKRRKFGVAELLAWREYARLEVTFAQDGGSESGTVVFDQHETVPHPSELCEQLGLDSVWFFGNGYAWAVHTGHDDWDLAELFERPADTESPS